MLFTLLKTFKIRLPLNNVLRLIIKPEVLASSTLYSDKSEEGEFPRREGKVLQRRQLVSDWLRLSIEEQVRHASLIPSILYSDPAHTRVMIGIKHYLNKIKTFRSNPFHFVYKNNLIM